MWYCIGPCLSLGSKLLPATLYFYYREINQSNFQFIKDIPAEILCLAKKSDCGSNGVKYFADTFRR